MYHLRKSECEALLVPGRHPHHAGRPARRGDPAYGGRLIPVDVVKIDQSFTAGITDNPTSHAIIATVIDLTHRLGMAVVAEGVETAAQRLEVANLGGETCQGYYFAMPMSADAINLLTTEPNGNSYLPLVPGPGR